VQHQGVVDALMAESVEVYFAINSGDMVSDGEIESQWDDFFAIEAPFLARTPIYLAIGNHEVHNNDEWDIPRRVFAEPTSVPPASDDEGFYHFVYGNLEVIVINVEVDTLYSGFLVLFGGDQEAWLLDVLANPPAGVDHRFLFIHQGPYSSKPGRNGNFWLRSWMADLKDGGIDFIISGHDHYAERGFSVNGIPYVIHGGGGAPLYDTLGPRIVADHTIMYGESRLGYVLVDIDGDRAEVSIRSLDGYTIDSFMYGDPSHPAACTTAGNCGDPPTYGCPDGTWECYRSACRFTCDPDLISSLVTCLSDEDCEDSVGDYCDGNVHCEMPGINPLEFHCLCDVAPQCVSDPNCEGLEPPIPNCPGTWACVDETCEFSPDELCDPQDAGPNDSDAGVIDAGPADSPDASGQGADNGGGCGCRSASGDTGFGAVWLLALLAVLRRRASS
jgi:MYXO-CTERM domain-containing protein